MARYEYTGVTKQQGANHPNKILAIKYDVNSIPPMSILAEIDANLDGTFTISWDEWTGRVIIGAVDDEGTIQKLDSVFHDYQTGDPDFDPLFDNVQLLLRMGGPNLLNTFVDASDNNHPVTNTTDTKNSSNLLINGRNSTYFDGSDYLSIPTSIAAAMAIGPFTIEGYINSTLETTNAIISQPINGGNGEQYFGIGAAGNLHYGKSPAHPNNFYFGTPSGTILPNTTHHVALDVDGTRWAIYVDGVKLAERIDSQFWSNVNTEVMIGRSLVPSFPSFQFYFKGYMSQFRITTGVNRYPADFKPPTKQYVYQPEHDLLPDFIYKSWWQFDEISGIAATDKSGAFDGTYTNASIRTLGKVGTGGLTLDGTNYVNIISGNNIFGLSSNFTVGYWIKPLTGMASEVEVFSVGDQGSATVTADNKGLRFRVLPDGKLAFKVRQSITTGYGGGTTGVWNTNLQTKLDSWNLVFCQRTNTEAFAYLYNSDGIFSEKLSLGGSYPLSTWGDRPYLIGAGAYSFDANIIKQSAPGPQIDEIFITSNLLSETNRNALWNRGVGKMPPISWADISIATYDNRSFSVLAQDGSPGGVALSPSGTKMYMMGRLTDRVYEYNLSVPFNITSAVYTGVNKVVGASVESISVSHDGNYMFVTDKSAGTLDTVGIERYPFGTPYDLSTLGSMDQSFGFGAEIAPTGFNFNSDGTKIVVVGDYLDRVTYYTLSTPYNLTTMTQVNFFALPSGAYYGIMMSPNGTRMAIVNEATDRIVQYNLSTPWDVTTAVNSNNVLLLGTQTGSPWDVAMYSTGFLLTAQEHDSILSYSFN